MQVLLIVRCDRNEDTRFIYITHNNVSKSTYITVVMQVLFLHVMCDRNEDTRFIYIHITNVQRVLTPCSDAGIIDR